MHCQASGVCQGLQLVQVVQRQHGASTPARGRLWCCCKGWSEGWRDLPRKVHSQAGLHVQDAVWEVQTTLSEMLRPVQWHRGIKGSPACWFAAVASTMQSLTLHEWTDHWLEAGCLRAVLRPSTLVRALNCHTCGSHAVMHNIPSGCNVAGLTDCVWSRCRCSGSLLHAGPWACAVIHIRS